MVTILIRTHNRPEQFKQCIRSIREQTHTDYRLFISVESVADYDYVRPLINKGDKIYKVEPGDGYHYNLHCNLLKSKVDDGYFFFLDDDDTLTTPYSLEYLMEQIDGDGVICQFSRAGWLKPSIEMVKHKILREGQIGMPCLVLHAKHKNIANVTNDESGDFNWIKTVLEQLDLKWIQFALVQSIQRNYGRTI